MILPQEIPTGARISIRIPAGIDEIDGRMKYSHFVGHVISWDGATLEFERDASRDGARAAQKMTIPADSICALKPVPERKPWNRRGLHAQNH